MLDRVIKYMKRILLYKRKLRRAPLINQLAPEKCKILKFLFRKYLHYVNVLSRISLNYLADNLFKDCMNFLIFYYMNFYIRKKLCF